MKTAMRFAPFVFAAAFTTAYADDALTPNTATGFRIVSIDEARELVGKAPFYDFRAPINYGKGHIKGAIALPYDQKSAKTPGFDASKDKFNTARLPGDKAKPVVFYSDGPTGWKSYKAAVVAARAGYTDVRWMREGTAGWLEKGHTLE